MDRTALLLLSGGIDSPVAGHLLQREGAAVEALHCSLEPFTDAAPEAKARGVAEHLGFQALHVARLGNALAEIARTCQHRLYFVLQKRLMLRVGERWARRTGAAVLATGESLGQVSSQTLQNLRAIDAAVETPVLRPLIGWDKTEIVRAARALGTYEISVGPEVCDVLGPPHPVTRARAADAAREEARLDYEALLGAAMATLPGDPPLAAEAK